MHQVKRVIYVVGSACLQAWWRLRAGRVLAVEPDPVIPELGATMRQQVMISIPCLLLGGSELATLALAKALVRGAYDVTVCCYYEYDATMVNRLQQAGADVVLLGLSRGSLGHLFATLADFFRRRRQDVAHVQYFAPGMVPILAARRTGVPHVFATIHDAGPRGYGVKAKAMLRFSACFTDHFFCVSQTAGLGIEREKLCPEIPPDAKVVGITGRVVRRKGHSTLLRAMPSHWEGFGLTAAEAMAAGKPVVGTDVTGLREVVEDGATGFLVAVGDADALAERLLYLLADDSLRTAIGRHGLTRVRCFFDLTTHDQRWRDAYASLLSEEKESLAPSGPASPETAWG